MLYIVRGKTNEQDRCLRVHAESAAEAEAIGWKSGLFVSCVEPVEKDSAAMNTITSIAKTVAEAWRETPANAMKCFGEPVSKGQVAALLFLGCATWVVNLRMFGFVNI
jgi:hypothetical protein